MTNGNIKTVNRAKVTEIQPKWSKRLGILREIILQALLIKINSLIVCCANGRHR